MNCNDTFCDKLHVSVTSKISQLAYMSYIFYKHVLQKVHKQFTLKLKSALLPLHCTFRCSHCTTSTFTTITDKYGVFKLVIPNFKLLLL